MAELAPLFVAHVPPAVRATFERAAIEEEVARLWSLATTAWPEIDLAPDAYLAFVAERLPIDIAEPTRTLRDLPASDLYLACACARGDKKAIACFAEHYAPAIRSVVTGRSARAGLADEVRQVLFERLFVSRDGAPSPISEYKGRGELGAWVRVAAARIMLNLLRSEKRRTAAGDAHAREPIPLDDPLFARLELRHREDFQAALREAASELTTRERNLLYQHHVDGLTMEQLSAVYGLHRVSVIRAIGKARTKLAEGTRLRLRERLRVSETELESLLRSVGPNLDLSIRRYLRPDGSSD